MKTPRPAGFTVIELLIGMAIAVVIFTVGILIVKGSSDARRASLERLAVSDKARIFFAQLEKEITAAWPGPWFDQGGADPLRKKDFWDGANLTLSTRLDARYDREKIPPEPFFVSVRYSVVNERMCRKTSYKTVAYDENGTPNSVPKSEIFAPEDAKLIGPNEPYFDGVQELQVYWLKWNPTKLLSNGTQTMLLEDCSDNPESATHLNVELKLSLDPKADKDRPFRVFNKVFKIPETFN
jgi:prepilin-type N-terminal cleavage/methylation domain-containing protein